MAGIKRQIVGELSKGKLKGSAFVSALNNALSPQGIISAKPQTQPLKMKANKTK